ncbi:uncharacterized protein LOC141702950 isoform X4 [Apium graveolens]|uniref:uncharacterized protein LOC141702950 isoform X4 n=1 Tax=Apium graveolens TaxID=4045 RepID=UPI003D790857
MSAGSQTTSVRPDIVVRVSKMKLDAMMDDFIKNSVLGRVLEGNKLITPQDIDEVISAEIPDEEVGPARYKAVFQFMMHGPCGAANPKCPCMSKGKCTKYYPKAFRDKTTVDDDGYALYGRRDTKRTVECNNILLNNSHVVPHHRGLLVKYQAHINVQWCNCSLSIKYMFKYIGKGQDTATFVLEKVGQQQTTTDQPSTSAQRDDFDEVTSYLSCRWDETESSSR